MAEPALLTKRAAVIALSRQWQASGRGAPGGVARPSAKRQMPIDALIAWAYREELPKAVPAPAMPTMSGGWDAVARWAEELSLAGRDPNRFGVIADPLAERLGGAPHPDAFAVHAAVQTLDTYAVQLPDDWNPFAAARIAMTPAHEAALARALEQLMVVDGAGTRSVWIAAARGKGGRAVRTGAAGQRVLRKPMSELIRRGAIMGAPSRPSVACESAVLRGPNGRALWFAREIYRYEGLDGGVVCEELERPTGWDDKRKCPKDGAYQKIALQPDPVPDLVATADYELWNAAMGMLVEDLRGTLVAHEVVGMHRADVDRRRARQENLR